MKKIIYTLLVLLCSCVATVDDNTTKSVQLFYLGENSPVFQKTLASELVKYILYSENNIDTLNLNHKYFTLQEDIDRFVAWKERVNLDSTIRVTTTHILREDRVNCVVYGHDKCPIMIYFDFAKFDDTTTVYNPAVMKIEVLADIAIVYEKLDKSKNDTLFLFSNPIYYFRFNNNIIQADTMLSSQINLFTYNRKIEFPTTLR